MAEKPPGLNWLKANRSAKQNFNGIIPKNIILNKKTTLLNRVNESPIQKGQSAQESKGLKPKDSERIARKHLIASAPPARTPNRTGVQAPAAAIPADADSAKDNFDVANIEDIRVAIGE